MDLKKITDVRKYAALTLHLSRSIKITDNLLILISHPKYIIANLHTYLCPSDTVPTFSSKA